MARNRYSINFLAAMLVGLVILPCYAWDLEKQLTLFQQAMDQKDNSVALEIGSSILLAITGSNSTNGGLRAYQSKLKLAEHLANQMIKHLRDATNAQMSVMMEDVFEQKANQKQKQKQMPLASAKSFYDASTKLFAKPVIIGGLDSITKTFLVQYYDLFLKDLVRQVAKTGQAISLAELSFKSTHDYVLVLPLLHTAADQAVNISVLPSWMDKAEHLSLFSDSCLFQFGMPYQAMEIARIAAQKNQAEFSESVFYRDAAQRCGSEYVHTAVDCLKRAYAVEDTSNRDLRVAILFDIVQLWLDTKNYDLAAGQARELSKQYPDHPECGRAMYLNYYALSRASKTRDILNTIDRDLSDPRCSGYQDNMMFIKWYALRNTHGEETRLIAVEHDLIQRCGNNPIIAPVMLSQATDHLARQNYGGAIEILTDLVERFPQTSAAAQAKRMLPKLENITNR